jgi:hypothetical protein
LELALADAPVSLGSSEFGGPATSPATPVDMPISMSALAPIANNNCLCIMVSLLDCAWRRWP